MLQHNISKDTVLADEIKVVIDSGDILLFNPFM